MPPALRLALLSALGRAGADDLSVDPGAAARDLSGDVETFWSLYADKGRLSLRLQYLYTCREAIDWLRRRVFDKPTFSEGGVTQSFSDALHGLEKMRADLCLDITALEAQIRAGLGAAVGVMVSDRPGIVPSPNSPDPNGALYRGDPLTRPIRWWNY